MRNEWVRDIKNEEDKKAFIQRLKSNQVIFDKEKTIIDSWIELEFKGSISEEDFSKPNWSEHQAYRNGKMKAYKEVLSLIKDLTSE